MILVERAEAYNKSFPDWPASHLHFAQGKLAGVWMLGNDYRNKTRLYGAYPPNYLRRVMAMFPDAKDPEQILHLFSGSLDSAVPGIRFDSNPDLHPDVVGDAHRLSSCFPRSRRFRLILADPPYSEADARRYGTEMIDRFAVIKECALVLRPGGHLIWLDACWPMFSKKTLSLVGTIAIIRSTNHRVRCVFVFERTRRERMVAVR